MWDWLTWSVVGYGGAGLFALAYVGWFMVCLWKSTRCSVSEWKNMTPEQRREFSTWMPMF